MGVPPLVGLDTVCRVGLKVLKIRTAVNNKYDIKMCLILKISL